MSAALCVRRKDAEMEKEVRTFTRNFDGRIIEDGEVMVPFEYSEYDAEAGNYVNPDCIRILKKGGRNFKVVYKAVPREWARAASSQLTLIQNETLGHYRKEGTISLDYVQEQYDFGFDSSPSVEEVLLDEHCKVAPPESSMIRAEETERLKNTVIRFAEELIEKSPKHGLAFVLSGLGYKGEQFADQMGLSKPCANHVLDQVRNLAPGRLDSFSQIKVDNLKCSRSSRADFYRDKAYEFLNLLLDMYFEE